MIAAALRFQFADPPAAANDDETGETEYMPVVALIEGAKRPIWDVTVEVVEPDGTRSRETIGATEDHPWRTTDGAWTNTSDLTIGGALVSRTGTATVVSLFLTNRISPTYNFEVGENHTYFVGVHGLWVHNANCPLKGPIAEFRRQLAASGKTPKWMNQWLRQGRSPPGHQVDHVLPRSAGGTDDAANLRLRTTADHVNRHRFYRPWEN